MNPKQAALGAKYLIEHKIQMMGLCFSLGLYWQGIIHDLTKFMPGEFVPFVEGCFSEKKDADKVRQSAALHRSRNKHHWEYWLIDNGMGNVALEMPDEYVLEMICDWIVHVVAEQKQINIKTWWTENANTVVLHDNTRKLVDNFINNMITEV